MRREQRLELWVDFLGEFHSLEDAGDDLVRVLEEPELGPEIVVRSDLLRVDPLAIVLI